MITVNFIDFFKNEVFLQVAFPYDDLPDVFETASTVQFSNKVYSVVEASPADSKDFLKTKEVFLTLLKTQLEPSKSFSNVLTVSQEQPQFIDSSPFNAFQYKIVEKEWRQSEFLKNESRSDSEIELKQVKNLMVNGVSGENKEHIHIRKNTNSLDLDLDLSELKEVLGVEEVGSLIYSENNKFIKNGFALKTKMATYYGTVENGIVKRLCVGEYYNENVVTELLQLTLDFKLVWIDWCQAIIF